MDAPDFSVMTAEDLLTLIEHAGKALDDKIAAERADIENRQIKLTKLVARRAGKDTKAGKKAATKPSKKPVEAKPPADTKSRVKAASTARVAEAKPGHDAPAAGA